MDTSGAQAQFLREWEMLALKIRNDARFNFSDISFRIVKEGEGESSIELLMWGDVICFG